MRGPVGWFGLGLLVGALAAWEAGRRFERFALSLSWALHFARSAWWFGGQALGWVVGVMLTVGAAAALMWWAF